MKNVLILGGGVSGLSSAYLLSKNGYNVEVIEKTGSLGGVSGSFKHKEFTLDYGPHKIYTQMPNIMQEIRTLVPDLIQIKKKSRIMLKKKYYNYPVGLLDILLKMNPLIGLHAGLSFGTTKIKTTFSKKEESYEDYIVNRFGKGVYNLVFRPYAEKVWGNPKELSWELAKTRVSINSMLSLLMGMIIKKKNPAVSADYFYYPKNGIVEISNKMAEEIKKHKGRITFNSKVEEIKVNNGKITEVKLKSKGKTLKRNPDYVISTIPIDELPKLIKPTFEKINITAENLKYRPAILFYLILNREKILEDNWLFYPEKDLIFTRISEQKNFSESCCPKDKTALVVELCPTRAEELSKLNNEQIYGIVINDLEKIKLIKSQDVIEYFSIKINKAYPVYDLKFRENVNIILDSFAGISNLITNGRQGLFNYNNIDHCMDMGFQAANFLINKNTGWRGKIKDFENYKIVD
ncbi:MAG: FAD-dependent oxidoreductase [Candidatus Nanoarchaeia archaeon]|nr:FAD-dependent oxidoreductase [Candidatus Nanoarchaeia archaeon]MDD5587611.1 FAD-dependent oxidoreductase [Candidatus Nanoarchaeia archaeon]